jgi:5'-deoxynucleotidase YfbR-like HD superfamily hydrolase
VLNIPNRLNELVSNNQIVPFIGSGFSIPSGVPTWASLVDGLVRNFAWDSQQPALKALSSGLEGADLTGILDSLTTTEFGAKEHLVERINSIRYAPSGYHRLLLELNCNTIITTNWDLLIEQALTQNQTTNRVIYRDIDVSQFDPDRAVQVIKLHGTIIDTASLVYKRSDYRRFWEDRPLLMNLVCTLMATKSFLFLGYGFGDPNVFDLLDLLKARLGPLRREHYALTFGQGDLAAAFKLHGITVINAAASGGPAPNYVGDTEEFLSKLTRNSRLVSLSNLERSRLVNEELQRLINRRPPKPILRMRGSLGWLSNPVPIEGDPIYGSDAQDQEERRMTELLCQFLESDSSARVRCILHLDLGPLIRAGYQPRHLLRRFSMVKEMLSTYGKQIEIVRDSTPSYLNQMLFDTQAYLFGFKRSHTRGIQRALVRRTRSVVREETKEFDGEFDAIRQNNLAAARDLGIDVAHGDWLDTYILKVVNEQVEALESGLTTMAAANIAADLPKDVVLFAHAVEFALTKHREFGQTREDEVTPYGIHILRVIEQLREVGLIDDFEILAAAALHDVVEDCGVLVDDIRSKHGDRVAKFVAEVSRSVGQSSADFVEQLGQSSREGKTIKLADRLDNVNDLRNFQKATFGGGPASVYLDESRSILEACGDANQRLADALEEAIRQTVAVFAQTPDAGG